jgi:colanic acid biosynthesis glycosyl transferase WcaI
MSRLRIGYVVQEYPPDLGAGPARVSEMARTWTAAGAEVTVITALPHRPQSEIHEEYRGRLAVEEDHDGIRVIRSWLYASPKRGLLRKMVGDGSFMFSGALNGILRGGRFDVIIASAPPFLAQVAAEAMHLARRTPMIVELRDLWPDYLVGMGMLGNPVARRALFGLEQHLLKRAAHVVVVTESFRRRVVEKGIPFERIDVIANGVDTTQYFPADDEPPVEALRRRDGEFVVGYLGNFGAGQDLSAIVRAAAELRDVPGLRIVLTGDGPDRARVTALSESLGLENLQICGSIPRDRTRAFYNACDVCLVPLAPIDIFQETVPSKIFEIMACGRPIVASLSGEAARIVTESECGLVAPPGRPEEIAGVIRQVAAVTDEVRGELGRNGRRYVTAHYERTTLAARYLDLLERVAGSSTVSARVRAASHSEASKS